MVARDAIARPWPPALPGAELGPGRPTCRAGRAACALIPRHGLESEAGRVHEQPLRLQLGDGVAGRQLEVEPLQEPDVEDEELLLRVRLPDAAPAACKTPRRSQSN